MVGIPGVVAQTTGLPLVRPYPAGRGSEGFVYGANFAVAGACALSNAFYEAEGFNVTWEDYSLGTQLKWFEQLLSSPSVLGMCSFPYLCPVCSFVEFPAPDSNSIYQSRSHDLEEGHRSESIK